jgi:propane monooxygenase coupling protein
MSDSKTRAAGAASGRTARNRVGISFMVSSDTEAIVEVTRQKYPDAKIDFRDCFYKVEREGSLDWSMDDVGERLGRPYDTDLFLVNMSSYYGRIVVSDGRVQISSEMVPNRFRD